jgi:hypothetical protein
MNDFGRKAYENEDKYTQINKMNTPQFIREADKPTEAKEIFEKIVL